MKLKVKLQYIVLMDLRNLIIRAVIAPNLFEQRAGL
jgi:hypothetical protein